MFLAGLLAMKLPETRNKAMPESIDDLYDLAGQGHSSSKQIKVKVRDIDEDQIRLLESQLDEQAVEAEVNTVSADQPT